MVFSTIGFSQNYFDSINTYISTLSPEKQIQTINAIPFDKMNDNAASAIKLYDKAIAKGENYPELLGVTYEQQSLAYYYNGDYDLSVQGSLKAIEIFERIGDKTKVGSIYANLGYQMKRRNLRKAFEYMRKGLDILLQTEDKVRINPAVNNYGVLHEMSGDIDSALYYYNKSLAIVEELKDSIGLPYSLNNIAGAYVINGEYEKALPYYERAYNIRLKRNDINGLAENATYYGDFYFKQEKYKEAIPQYLKAFKLCKQIEYTYLQKVNAEQLAKCYSNINQYDSSLSYHKKAVELNDKLLNESTVKTINNLEIQFETEKKEKQIAEQDAEITKKELQIKQRTYLLYSVIGIAILVLIIGYFIFRQIRFKQQQLIEENRLKDKITSISVLSKLNEERLRISKDLHDNIGSQLTFIISSIDNLTYFFDEQQSQLKEKLDDLNEFAKTAIKELRLTINHLNKK